MVVDDTCVKVLAWYDNEIGYVHRMVELAQKVGTCERGLRLSHERGPELHLVTPPTGRSR
jgi:hypothetical protein